MFHSNVVEYYTSTLYDRVGSIEILEIGQTLPREGDSNYALGLWVDKF